MTFVIITFMAAMLLVSMAFFDGIWLLFASIVVAALVATGMFVAAIRDIARTK